MKDTEAKRLRDEAGQLYEQAKTIMDEFKGKEMPQDKSDQVDRLLDDVETKTEAARKVEEKAGRADRLAQHERFFNEPSTRKEAFKSAGESAGGEIKVEWGGRQLTGDEIAELNAMSPHKSFIQGLNAEYRDAYVAYLKKGIQGLSGAQVKALSAGDPGAGGYLVQDTFLSQFVAKQREASSMRRIATVLPPVPSGSAIAASEESMLSDAEWTTEVGSGSEDLVKPFGGRKLTPKPLAKRIKVSNTLLRNPFFDVEAYVRDRMAYKHAIPEENAFINGNGVNQPLGLLDTANAKLPAYTTASSTSLYGDDVINWVYSLPQGYAARPTTRILCNRSFIRKIRTLASPKSGTNFTNYLWQPGLAGGMPNTILDIPYELSDKFPTGLTNDAWDANALVAVVGDFSYYWIADALQLSIQRLVELYAEANQTGFIGRKETDGMPVLAEAFYVLKIKA